MQARKDDETDKASEPLPEGSLEALSQPLSSAIADDPLTSAALARGKAETRTAPADTKEILEYLWNVHGYVNSYIRFSDSKAGLLIVFNSSLIGALYAANIHHHFMKVASNEWTWVTRVAGAAFVLLLLGIILGVWAVVPRLWNKQTRGFVFWESIVGHESGKKFWGTLLVCSQQLPEHLASHLYMVASIARRKFRVVAVAMWASLTGMIAAAIVLLTQ